MMFFWKVLGRFFPSLVLRKFDTDALIEAYDLADRGLSSALLEHDVWLKLLKSKHRIEEELYRRDPEWND
jgi:hypothetical protein